MLKGRQSGHSCRLSSFSYLQFGIAAPMMGGGLYNLEASFAAISFYAMAAFMLVSARVAIAKSIRDSEESDRLHNKIEDAKTERLVAEVSFSDNI